MRSINELLILLLKEVKEDNDFAGLCGKIWTMYMSNIIKGDEWGLLLQYITNHKPFVANFRKDSYYWKQYKIKPRIKWLNKHIKLTSKIK